MMRFVKGGLRGAFCRCLATILLFQLILPANFISQAQALTTSIDFTTTNDYTLEDNTKIEVADGKLQLVG